MATYKLMQDIEAEDHILGPLSLRQFIFALIAVFMFYLCFLMITTGVPFLVVVFLPPALFFGFFALPFGRDQPTEVWALGKLRFWFLPRRRVWNQSGVKELVTITVPKKVERVLTNGLSQTEVHSRLQALANTIDSRGWVVKHVDTSAYNLQLSATADSDRLINVSNLPQEVPDNDVSAVDDILDADNNPIARQFNSLINDSSLAHRQQLVDRLNDTESGASSYSQATSAVATPADQWFMDDADRADEAELSNQLKARSSSTHDLAQNHLHTLQPTGSQPITPDPVIADTPVTASPDPAILSLAQNNDLNVATLARQARKNEEERGQTDEVVISLH